MEINEFGIPYRHWVIENTVEPSDIVSAAAGSVPRANHQSWARYENELEHLKWAMNDRLALGDHWRKLIECLTTPAFVERIAGMTGIDGLFPDPADYGGGLHVSFPGAYLAPHIDYAIHPTLPNERRVSLILHLNAKWESNWGGATQLCDLMGIPATGIEPAFNRAVVWCNDDYAIHGMERVSTIASSRLTAAVYYLGPIRPGACRRRALFVPQRG